MKKQVTERQKQLLTVIYEYIKSIGYSLSFEEMRQNLGVVSNQSITDDTTLEGKAISIFKGGYWKPVK